MNKNRNLITGILGAALALVLVVPATNDVRTLSQIAEFRWSGPLWVVLSWLPALLDVAVFALVILGAATFIKTRKATLLRISALLVLLLFPLHAVQRIVSHLVYGGGYIPPGFEPISLLIQGFRDALSMATDYGWELSWLNITPLLIAWVLVWFTGKLSWSGDGTLDLALAAIPAVLLLETPVTLWSFNDINSFFAQLYFNDLGWVAIGLIAPAITLGTTTWILIALFVASAKKSSRAVRIAGSGFLVGVVIVIGIRLLIAKQPIDSAYPSGSGSVTLWNLAAFAVLITFLVVAYRNKAAAPAPAPAAAPTWRQNAVPVASQPAATVPARTFNVQPVGYDTTTGRAILRYDTETGQPIYLD